MIYRIYKIKNEANGMEYVGYTSVDIHIRLKRHLYSVKRGSNSYIHNAIRIHGMENFTIVELYTSKDKKHTLDIMEAYFIDEYKTYYKDGGYNLTRGGDGFTGTHSESTKKLIGDRCRGRVVSSETRVLIKNNSINLHKEKKIGTYGKVRSIESRKLQRSKMIGKKLPMQSYKDYDAWKENNRKAQKGKRFFNNGIKEIRVVPGTEPLGYTMGRIAFSKEHISKITKSKTGTKWNEVSKENRRLLSKQRVRNETGRWL